MNEYLPVEVIEAWLSDKHVTLYLDWDITDPKQLRQAADFINNMIFDLSDYADYYIGGEK